MLQPVRGTHDLLPEECLRQRKLKDLARAICSTYGYDEIATPLFEFTSVFHRLGETSDIVSKETYTFKDRGGEELTLRPEGTAPVVRALISNGLTQQVPLKFFYEGPMFRYDRPQKGRYRQFEQIGVELLGVASPIADVETIAMAAHILEALNLEEIILEINTLGDYESRDRYRDILVKYFSGYKEKLSEDSRARLERNPLRILDSKDRGDREFIKEAPAYEDSLNQASKDFFARVLEGLDLLDIPYKINNRLVRGLDYYCHTTFEFISHALGAQGTVLAGGRYDSLVKQMGGPDVPGIGWAGGVERMSLLSPLTFSREKIIALVPLGEEAEQAALKLAQTLRREGIRLETAFSGNMSKRLKRADKIGAFMALILGEDEMKEKSILARDLASGAQEKVSFDTVTAFLKTKLK